MYSTFCFNEIKTCQTFISRNFLTTKFSWSTVYLGNYSIAWKKFWQFLTRQSKIFPIKYFKSVTVPAGMLHRQQRTSVQIFVLYSTWKCPWTIGHISYEQIIRIKSLLTVWCTTSTTVILDNLNFILSEQSIRRNM